MSQCPLVSHLLLSLVGLTLVAAPVARAQGFASGGGLADLKGRTILEAGMLVARVVKDSPAYALQGQTLEWYELVLMPAQTRVCLTFLTPRPRLPEPRVALVLSDTQQRLTVALLRDTVGGTTVEVAPVQLVQCPL